MDGIICVNKPKGITSFDVVRRLKRVLREKKIGHTGTLDPLATGVMILCLGKGTKLVQGLEAKDKSYIASFELGYKTDTYDTEGVVTHKSHLDRVSREILIDVLEKFKGDTKQVPPMYSALKQNGIRLYDLARQGITVERKERDVNISELALIEFDGTKGKLLCSVSKGTYIRSLIFDIGEELQTFATMTGLERTRVGDTSLEQCYTLDEIELLAEKEDFSFLQSIENYFGYPIIEIHSEEQLKYYKNGNSFNYQYQDGFYSVYYKNEFIGLGNIQSNRLKGYKYY